MLNEGMIGLLESVDTVISADRSTVSLVKTLIRPRSDAAIPRGQALELEFNVASIGFDITVRDWSGSTIGTDERRNGSLDTSAALRPGSPPSWTEVRRPGSPHQMGDDAARALARIRLPFDEPRSPWDIQPPYADVPPDPSPDPEIPFRIRLTPPRGKPWVIDRPRASALKNLPFQGAFPTPGAAERALGIWKVAVENINETETAMRFRVEVQAVHSIRDLKTQDIPLSLLNHVTATALKKVSPTIAYRNGGIRVETPTHFLRLFGVEVPEFELSGILGELAEEIPSFTPMLAVVESQERLTERLRERQRTLNDLLAPDAPPTSDVWYSQDAQRKRVEAAMQDCIERACNLLPENAVFCVVIEGMFSSGSIEFEYVGEVAHIENRLPQLALIFDRKFRLHEVLTTLVMDMSPALVKALAGTAALGLIFTAGLTSLLGPAGTIIGLGATVKFGTKLYNTILEYGDQDKIRDAIRDKAYPISEYARAIFERMSAVGALGLDCQLRVGAAADDSDVLRVSYCDPSAMRPPRPITPRFDPIANGSSRLTALAMVDAPGGSRRTPPRTGLTFRRLGKDVREVRYALGRETPGDLPRSMTIRDPSTLGVLDQHDSIVVVMMENRSFDHMFFQLGEFYPQRGYDAPPSTFTNLPPVGFAHNIGVTSNKSVGIGNTLIFTHPEPHSADPSHSFEPTMFQIGGGTADSTGTGQMQGFARDFSRKSDSPQIVLSYHLLEDLPVFRALADYYAVCDRWFSALPVGTQPNRLAAMQGNVPFLHNIDMEDPSLGFLEDYSLFDLMSAQGISWKFFESDIGTIRLYDRFRLDVENVRPLGEMDKHLRRWRDSGSMPRVIFIEPEFLFGNDDHPPVDVRDGQDFIKHIVGRFIDYGLMNRVLFLVTYDEHGGFFDHIAPPGTRFGDPAWIGNVANMFPQDRQAAPNCMGVRVPSFAMSKFISNEAKHTVLDHTSVLKTILLHNRVSISTSQFSRFGDRVLQGSHLGELMDRTTARSIDFRALAAAMQYSSSVSWFRSRGRIVDRSLARLNRVHPGRVLQQISTPRPRRFVSA